MALVVASSTARASRSGALPWKPAASAIFLVTSRTRPRKLVWLGMVRSSAGFGGRRAFTTSGRACLPLARPAASARRPFGMAEAPDGLPFRGEDAVEVMEAEDLEDVVDGVAEVGEPEVAAVAADLLDGAHHGPQPGAG